MRTIFCLFILAFLPLNCDASRVKESVTFNLDYTKTNDPILPFSAHVPADFRGSFIRFINPKNGKSVVAKIINRTSDDYRTSPEVKRLIDIESAIAIVFIEAVY